MVLTVGLELRTEDLTRLATLRLNHSATPPIWLIDGLEHFADERAVEVVNKVYNSEEIAEAMLITMPIPRKSGVIECTDSQIFSF